MSRTREEVPFGWTRRNGIFTLEDLEQWVIKRILKEKLEGKSLEEISEDLTKLGVRPRNGGLWFPRRIKKVLSENELLSKSLMSNGNLPVEKEPAPPVVNVPPPVEPISNLGSKEHLRIGGVIYEIKESYEAIEESESEVDRRSTEVGKIITHALLSVTARKRQGHAFVEDA